MPRIFAARTIRLFAVVSCLLVTACGQNNADAQQEESQLSIAELRSELESGSTQLREEPFEVRPFDPYIGDDWIGNAVAYGPYREGQEPGGKGPSDEELLEDLKIIIRHWNFIRLYGADADTRRIVGLIDEHNLPIKVIQGIWLSPEENDPEQRTANINQVMLALELSNTYPDVIAAISVGNETQVFWSGHIMRPENVIRYIRAVRSYTTVPVTTADDYLYWNTEESRRLASEVDFVFPHIHPSWNGKTLEEAMPWMIDIYEQVNVMHPDREVVIAETGWPTDYNERQTGDGQQGTLIKGEIGYDAQAAFLKEMHEWIENNKVTSFLFEAFDEPWKGGGDNSPPDEVEKHWGVYKVDRTPKPSFTEFLEYIGRDSE